MKTLRSVLLVVLCLGLIVPFVFADGKQIIPKKFNSVAELQQYFGPTLVFHQIYTVTAGGYIIGPYDPNSTDGFIATVWKDGREWKVRIRSAQYEAYNVGPITGTFFIINVADGQEKSITYSKTVCETNTVSINAGVSLFSIISLGVTGTQSGQVCETWTKGLTYKFPDHCKGGAYNSASFYGGMTKDRVGLVVDLVPWERSDEAGYEDCMDTCDLTCNDTPPDPRQPKGLALPSDCDRCYRRCERRYPLVLKMGEMQTFNGKDYLPRPIEWSLCESGN